jgi:hypothetical protein
MVCRVSDVESSAEKRRVALKKVLNERGINPTDLASMCGWGTPNVIYNFFAGRTTQLSTQKYEEICKALPGITVSDLTGGTVKKTAPQVLVKTECRAGYLRDTFSLPASKIRELPLPVDDAARVAGAYAAVVRHPGAESIYPEGSLLLCIPVDRFEGEITRGRRLLVERLVDTKLEVTVREVQEDAEGRFWLSQRSTDPRFSDAVKLPQQISGKPWREKGEKYAIAGIVIGAFVPEQ